METENIFNPTGKSLEELLEEILLQYLQNKEGEKDEGSHLLQNL